jgi:hypothetical protein
MKKQLGNATFDISLSWEDMGSETNGECCWTLGVSALRRIFARFPELEMFGMIPDAIGDTLENADFADVFPQEPKFADLAGNETVSIRDADSGIVLIAAMAEIGSEMGKNFPVIVNIDWDTERRAQVNGARDALRNGVSIDDVVSAVSSITAEFESRFKAPIGTIWSDIFRGMVVVPK